MIIKEAKIEIPKQGTFYFAFSYDFSKFYLVMTKTDSDTRVLKWHSYPFHKARTYSDLDFDSAPYYCEIEEAMKKVIPSDIPTLIKRKNSDSDEKSDVKDLDI